MEYEFIGGVYFIRETATGLVKIGASENCKMRIQSYNTFPHPIEFLYFLESRAIRELERAFKHLFENKQKNGEWFYISEYEIDWIQSGDYPPEIKDYIEGTSQDSLQKIIKHLLNYKNFIWKKEDKHKDEN